MEWLTTDYIQAQAQKGRRQALECSIEHWRQLAGATYNSIKRAIDKGLVDVGSDYCALCEKYYSDFHCGPCPLCRHQKNECGANTQWGKVTKGEFFCQPTKRRYPAFHREAKKMLKVLRQVHKKLYKK